LPGRSSELTGRAKSHSTCNVIGAAACVGTGALV
jgi:hypothetical protein